MLLIFLLEQTDLRVYENIRLLKTWQHWTTTTICIHSEDPPPPSSRLSLRTHELRTILFNRCHVRNIYGIMTRTVFCTSHKTTVIHNIRTDKCETRTAPEKTLVHDDVINIHTLCFDTTSIQMTNGISRHNVTYKSIPIPIQEIVPIWRSKKTWKQTVDGLHGTYW